MGGRKTYNKVELADFISKFISINGRVPERRDFERNKDYPCSRQYVREWGSWGKAIIELGYRDSERERKKLNTYICKVCGKTFESYGTRKFCSIKCRDILIAKKNLKRIGSFSFRKIAFNSYDWKCEICKSEKDIGYLCGKTKNKYPTILDTHHIDGDHSNFKFTNLALLCPTCHAKIHRNIIVDVRREGIFNILKYRQLTLQEYALIVSGKNKALK